MQDYAPPPDHRLRVRNPMFHPLYHGSHGSGDSLEPYEPTLGVAEYVDEVRAVLRDAHKNMRAVPMVDNLTREQREALQSLRTRTDIVICESESSVLGLVLPHTQRLDRLNVPATLIYFASKWLRAPICGELCSAKFNLARRSVGRVASILIRYRFP